MKIGIVSDTHSNMPFLCRVVESLIKNHRVEKIYHLGDSYLDSRRLLDYSVAVKAVPGLYDPEYVESSVEPLVVDENDGVNVLLAHDKLKITPAWLTKAHLVVFGHTHQAAIYQEQGKIWCNPGHLKSPLDKKQPPSFALLEINPQVITISIRNLEDSVTQEKQFSRLEIIF